MKDHKTVVVAFHERTTGKIEKSIRRARNLSKWKNRLLITTAILWFFAYLLRGLSGAGLFFLGLIAVVAYRFVSMQLDYKDEETASELVSMGIIERRLAEEAGKKKGKTDASRKD